MCSGMVGITILSLRRAVCKITYILYSQVIQQAPIAVFAQVAQDFRRHTAGMCSVYGTHGLFRLVSLAVGAMSTMRIHLASPSGRRR